MDKRLFRLYSGEELNPIEEIQLIKERIAEMQLDINISEIIIDANKKNISFFEKRLDYLNRYLHCEK